MPDKANVIREFEDFVKSFSKRDDTYYKKLFISVLALLKEQERLIEHASEEAFAKGQQNIIESQSDW